MLFMPVCFNSQITNSAAFNFVSSFTSDLGQPTFLATRKQFSPVATFHACSQKSLWVSAGLKLKVRLSSFVPT